MVLNFPPINCFIMNYINVSTQSYIDMTIYPESRKRGCNRKSNNDCIEGVLVMSLLSGN